MTGRPASSHTTVIQNLRPRFRHREFCLSPRDRRRKKGNGCSAKSRSDFCRSSSKSFNGLDLRLVASHPDGKGGLAFLAEYPNAYMLFVFGISSVVAAALAKHSLLASLSLNTFTLVVSGWLVIVVALFAYPLSAFSVPLMRMKQAGLLLLSTQATRYHRAAERKLLGRNVIAEDPDEAGEEVADPSKQFDVARKLSTMLISRAAIVPLAGAALLPFVVVCATRLPFKEVWSVVKKLLLL